VRVKIDVHIHTVDSEKIIRLLTQLTGKVTDMAGTIQEELAVLATEVAETDGAVDSAITLINGLREQIAASQGDPARVAELAAALDAMQSKLAAAVGATPA
jgi:phage-related tail protein